MDNRTIYCPPKFHGLNFLILKVKMTIFLPSQGSRVANVITKPFVCPKGDKDAWSEIAVKEYDVNSKAHYALLQALNDDDISKVINCTSAYHIWYTLITTHEGNIQVKKIKFDLFSSQYDSFYMLDGESIDDMLTRFTTIPNRLIFLGKSIKMIKKCEKSLKHFLKLAKSKLLL